jgi:hypothetical protein
MCDDTITVNSLAQFIRACVWIVHEKQHMYIEYPGAFNGALLVDMCTANVVYTVWSVANFKVRRQLLRKLKDKPRALVKFCWRVAS